MVKRFAEVSAIGVYFPIALSIIEARDIA